MALRLDQRLSPARQRVHLDMGVQGDIGETIRALLPLMEAKSDRRHLDDALVHYAKARKRLDKHVKGITGHRPIHPEFLTSVVSELASDDAVFTADVGMCTVWAARYLKMTPRSASARVLHPRVDGQRASPGDRGAGPLSKPAGDLSVG